MSFKQFQREFSSKKTLVLFAMKKILIFTYYWPPSGGSGVQRWMYFSKYLSSMGYKIQVVTVDPKKASYSKFDKSLNKHVEGIVVHHTNTLELTKLYSRVTSKSSNDGIPQGGIENKKFLFQRIARFIRGNFFIPDSRVGWKNYAIKKGKEILENEEIDLIISTGPPHSTHLIARNLKSKYSVKWLADFRDPWTEVYYNNLFYRLPWIKRLDAKMEKNVLNRADKVLTIGKNMADLLKKKVVDKTKVEYIYNGFDSDIMASVIEKRSSTFDIVFTGLLSENQDYSGLIEVFNTLGRSVDKNKIRFILAGKIDISIVSILENQLLNIEVVYLGYIPHQEAIELMINSNLLITILPRLNNSEIMISGKIMEYIATGNPILMFGSKKSEAALLLSQSKNTITVEENQLALAVIFLKEMFLQWENSKVNFVRTRPSVFISEYSRENTAMELSKLIERM